MIKNSTGKKVESKSMVCVECITLMTPTDHATHDGKCQLCRGDNEGMKLFSFAYVYEYSEEPSQCYYVAATYDEAKTTFDNEHDDVEYYDVDEVTQVGNYNILVSHI